MRIQLLLFRAFKMLNEIVQSILNLVSGAVIASFEQPSLGRFVRFTFVIKSSFNPIALRKAKIVYSFCLSECNRVKLCCILFYSELNLAVAAHVSDKILDEVIDRLSKNHKTLVSIHSRTSMARTP